MCSFSISTLRNACLISAIIPIGLNRNLSITSNILLSKFGPGYKQLLSDSPFAAHDASNTARIFVVSLSVLITGRCGK